MADGFWKCSLRSKYDDLDVGAVAAKFEGGGHKAAAGCRVAGDREQVTTTIRQALREESGSALVFLPGQAEIIRVAERLQNGAPTDTDIVPLYGQLTADERSR